MDVHLIISPRKYRNGSIITTYALNVSISSSLGNGLPETRFITSIVMRC